MIDSQGTHELGEEDDMKTRCTYHPYTSRIIPRHSQKYRGTNKLILRFLRNTFIARTAALQPRATAFTREYSSKRNDTRFWARSDFRASVLLMVRVLYLTCFILKLGDVSFFCGILEWREEDDIEVE